MKNGELFWKQRNVCLSLLRKSKKKDYFEKLNEKRIDAACPS